MTQTKEIDPLYTKELPDEGLVFSDWLYKTQEKRDELDAYGHSHLPMDLTERHGDIEKAIHACDEAARLLADAETYLAQAKGIAVLKMLDDYPDLSAKEREVLARSEVRFVQRLVDGISITAKTLRDRIMYTFNANRSR